MSSCCSECSYWDKEMTMTISQHIDNQVTKLDLSNLTKNESEWLHWVNSLATLAYLSKFVREMKEKKNVHA